jgi:hypothetical protein
MLRPTHHSTRHAKRCATGNAPLEHEKHDDPILTLLSFHFVYVSRKSLFRLAHMVLPILCVGVHPALVCQFSDDQTVLFPDLYSVLLLISSLPGGMTAPSSSESQMEPV